MLGRFPIGFWNYPNIDSYGPEEVTRWTKCGMTLNQSPRFDYAKNTKEQMLALLDECHRQGMKLMLCIAGIEFRDALKDIDAMRKTYIRAYEDFGKHPATYGFYVGDEPVGKEENQACVEAYRIYLEISPELTPFLNFNPYTPGFEEQCYFHSFEAEGKAPIYNPDIHKGLTISFDPKSLDYFTEWKMMGYRDYVLGLEPGNCHPDGRDVMRKEGTLKFLQPGESVTYEVAVDLYEK